MSANIDMNRLNEHDQMVARETLELVYQDLKKWDDALRINQTRAEETPTSSRPNVCRTRAATTKVLSTASSPHCSTASQHSKTRTTR